jgi:hypothetical protein
MRRIIPFVAAIAIGLSGAALAQNPGTGPGYGPGYGHGMMGPGYGMMGGWHFDSTWFDTAKKEIGINAGQEKAWTAYVDAVRDNFQFMQSLRSGMNYDTISKMTPDQRYEFMLGIHKSRTEQMNKVFDARRGLFAVLDAGQREKASATLTPGFYGHGFGPGMGRGGMMGGPGAGRW